MYVYVCVRIHMHCYLGQYNLFLEALSNILLFCFDLPPLSLIKVHSHISSPVPYCSPYHSVLLIAGHIKDAH